MANGKNYSVYDMGSFADLADKVVDGATGRVMLGATLGLTGCEVSINSMKEGGFIPFVHAHKMNEELYIIVSGEGMAYIDGEEFPIGEGSMIRVAPEGHRAIKATSTLTYICIQASQGTLTQATQHDGVISEEKASWMK